MENLIYWIGLIIVVSEAVLRLIPDKNWTGLIGVIINLLKVVSDYFNREKRYFNRPK